MNHPTTSRWLFLTILVSVILAQAIVLHWGPEAVFFATWLLLALIVRHDSRISAAVGLAFLATCPFLLIAKKEAVAETAANYAYYFLVIGVAVQLEELLLDRYGWLKCKLDLSYLWRPISQAVGRCWAAVVQASDRQLAAEGASELVRLIQVVGTVGLVLVFLGAAFVGARLSVLLPLLGGAVLCPFLVWGLRLAIRTMGSAWLLRVVLVLAVLVLASAEMVWLYNLVSADRLARLRMTYDLIAHLDEAGRSSPVPEGETVGVGMWTIEGVSRRVLSVRPAFSGASRISYQQVGIEHGAVLAFDLATAPQSWTQSGDGVTFAIYVESGQGMQQLFSTYMDPKRNVADRRWHPHTVDLSAYSGQVVTLIFETGTGPAGDSRNDWAAWGWARLLQP